MHGCIRRYRSRLIRASVAAASLALATTMMAPTIASARPADIRIHGTAPEGYVNIRPDPNKSQNPIGRIAEGVSPDYNCFTYGENIGGVPIWFSVNYAGVTGYYASYYDDSSYHSDAELTAKYGIPKCGATPPPPPPPPPAPPPPTHGGSVFYAGDPDINDGSQYVGTNDATVKRLKSQWYGGSCNPSSGSHDFGSVVNGRVITTLTGFSSGRLGTLYFLEDATRAANIDRVVLFDPGNLSDLNACDRSRNASSTLANWLTNNPTAKLVILAGKRTAESSHKGIQEVYFPAIRGRAIAKRVIVCNLDGWDHADVIKGYKHFIANPPDKCPSEYLQWSP